jgi:nitrogen fixation protein NifU and related proteins
MVLEDLYREVILDHYRNPRNRQPLAKPELSAEGVNPLCGDEVTVELSVEGGRVARISVRGQGCSISQASGSMMGDAVGGLTKEEISSLTDQFRRILTAEEPVEEPGLGELDALQGVRKYPVRVKCALLPWITLEDALGAQRG